MMYYNFLKLFLEQLLQISRADYWYSIVPYLNRCAETAAPSTDGQGELGAEAREGQHTDRTLGKIGTNLEQNQDATNDWNEAETPMADHRLIQTLDKTWTRIRTQNDAENR